jgi:hypothetical protein
VDVPEDLLLGRFGENLCRRGGAQAEPLREGRGLFDAGAEN